MSDDWRSWGNHVLEKIKELSDDNNSSKESLYEIKGDIKTVNTKIDSLVSAIGSSNNDKELRLRKLEESSNTWNGKISIVSTIASVVVAGIVSLIVKTL